MDRDLLFQFMRVKFREAGFTPEEVQLHVQSFTERYQGKTDEEIEADLMRRGGPSRVVATVIEKRNSVLMEDEDYRAFVESHMEKADAAAAPEEDADIRIHTSAQEEEPVRLDAAEPVAEEDPLAVWFAGDGTPEEALPPLFRESDSKKGAASDTVQNEMPETGAPQQKSDVGGTQTQTVHTIPLFPETPELRQTKPQNAAPGEQDMSRTRVMPTAEQAVVPPVPQHASQPPRTPDVQGQQLWGSSHITDEVPQRRTQRPQPQQLHAPQRQGSARPAREPRYEYADRGNVTRLQEMTYWGEGSEEGVRRFRILFAVSLPFVIALLLVYLILAIGIVLGIVALMIGLVIALVFEVAVGSLIALIGIIYGISQVFLVLPIGMFELGLGVAVVGITMLAGIVIYNLAVRFLPFVLRKFIAFQGVFRRFLQDLYYYVKGECYRR